MIELMGCSIIRTVCRWVAAIAFVLAGVNHFLKPQMYEQIVPPLLPSAKWLVIISGIAEIVGAIGLLIPNLRRAAGIGLIALLVAVFPANIYMAIQPQRAGLGLATWMLWLRLPIQFVLIAWIWWVSLRADGPECSGPDGA